MNNTITLDVFELISLGLIVIFVVLLFNLLTLKWSYKISKPYAWEFAVNNKVVSTELQALERTYRDKVRFYTFWFLIERLKAKNVKGAFAELGVYKGETAKFIHLMDKARTLHLFDTFEGFSESDLSLESNQGEKYSVTNFSDTSLHQVKKYIGNHENIHYHPGFFPASATNLEEQFYAFVHLDADLYKPTIEALNYFYPKLSPGGVIIVHDYNHTWYGIPKAIVAFENTILETFVPVSDWQGSVMLVKNS